MLYRLRQSLNYLSFNRAIAAIHTTPPLAIRDSDLRIVSMVAVERDLPMYLLAAKGLYRRIGHGRFVVIPDRPLPAAWRDRLRHHLGDAVTFLPLADIPVGSCQRGGTWERLLACLDLSAAHYVVQMDADTLALGEIPEVVAAIAENRAFTLVDYEAVMSFEEAADRSGRDGPIRHVQDEAERAFARHPRRAALKYMRGSSGFAGFARGGIPRAEAERFHAEMEALLGPDRWRCWGTEQVASNVMIANSPDPLALPYPAYASIGPDADLASVRFAHFFGTHRFDGGRFARIARRFIETELLA
ncbi:hypothetical protein [Elioraea sp.]|uniref:hypothetical protein n=1 Tax=Elioraea sp. TaxID=2185103 RepID=UPI00307FA03A